jgi:hypothetical protein
VLGTWFFTRERGREGKINGEVGERGFSAGKSVALLVPDCARTSLGVMCNIKLF